MGWDQDHLTADEATAFESGKDAGRAAGSWVVDGNTTTSTARTVLQQLDDHDPELMDMIPNPLSGEWAGESIPELSGYYGIDLEDDNLATLFETAYVDGWMFEVARSAHAILDETE